MLVQGEAETFSWRSMPRSNRGDDDIDFGEAPGRQTSHERISNFYGDIRDLRKSFALEVNTAKEWAALLFNNHEL